MSNHTSANDPTARRPLKSRSTAWAAYFSKTLLRLGFTPNLVSLLSIFCAAVGGGSMLMAKDAALLPSWAWWLVAAAGTQLRLFCNLMDGLLAIEGGLKSPTGDLYNEIPDRVADALLLVPLGYAGGTELTTALGWAAAVGAVFTAYVRALGAALTGAHDFSGPMAKPQRMAAVTLGVLGLAVLAFLGKSLPVVSCTLTVVNLGILVTLARRMKRLAFTLDQRA